MSRKVGIIVFLVLMGAGGAAYAVIRAGWYPVAIVNSEIVSARLFERELGVALNYYLNTVLKDAREAQAPAPNEEFVRELRRAVLDDLVEKRLIRQLARKTVGERLPALVNEKIAFLDEGGEQIPSALQSLYGMSLEEFRELVMIPEAERVILKNEMFSGREEGMFTDYLARQRKEARISVFSDVLTWRGGRIEHK